MAGCVNTWSFTLQRWCFVASSFRRWELKEAEVKSGVGISSALGRPGLKVGGKAEAKADASGYGVGILGEEDVSQEH